MIEDKIGFWRILKLHLWQSWNHIIRCLPCKLHMSIKKFNMKFTSDMQQADFLLTFAKHKYWELGECAGKVLPIGKKQINHSRD